MNRPSSLPRPAALGKHRPARIGRASKQARALERFVPLRARRQQTRTLQRIRSKDFLIDLVPRPLRFFHHRQPLSHVMQKASKMPASYRLNGRAALFPIG